MSEAGLQAVRRMVDAWNRGDLSSWAEELDDEIVWVPLAENPQTEPICGRDAVLEFVSDWVEPWQEYRIEVTRAADRGEWVFLATHQSGRHEGSEIGMDMYAAGVYRDGKLIECRWFTNEADALKAAGLEDAADE